MSTTVSGACSIKGVSGMVRVLEEVTPSVLEWKAIDQSQTVSIPLNKLRRLQAPKESNPKMMLRILYDNGGEQEKDLRLSFTNRPTMNNIKESLQTIIARSKTIIKDSPTPNQQSPQPQQQPLQQQQQQSQQQQQQQTTRQQSPSHRSAGTPSSSLDFSNPESLSDASLLKNFELQKKLLLEDKTLFNIFTQSVLNFKLSRDMFWSARLGQLRTFALTISQHRGPYNVLSTIRPVATSDNQVNVNVTRETINEIFDTYPLVRRAFSDLVPAKFNEGEFWSRFFNSKLFRRLRGDKINTINTRGDVILDKYLYIDLEFLDREEQAAKLKESELLASASLEKEGAGSSGGGITTAGLVGGVSAGTSNAPPPVPSPAVAENNHVSKFLDLLGNEEDNSQRLGNKPDITMRFVDDTQKLQPGAFKSTLRPSGQENEMIILMKNMNKLSSKIISMNSVLEDRDASHIHATKRPDDLSRDETNEYQEELDLHDLNQTEELKYITLNLSNNTYQTSMTAQPQDMKQDVSTSGDHAPLPVDGIMQYLQASIFTPSATGLDLNDTFQNRDAGIDKAVAEFTTITKSNARAYRMINNVKDVAQYSENNVINDAIYQELITFNITIMEFLSHFWKIFLYDSNPVQLKKIVNGLAKCKKSLTELSKNIEGIFDNHPVISKNEKLKDKLMKDLNNCVYTLQSGLDKAVGDYVRAVKAAELTTGANGEGSPGGTTSSNELNENGKRELQQQE